MIHKSMIIGVGVIAEMILEVIGQGDIIVVIEMTETMWIHHLVMEKISEIMVIIETDTIIQGGHLEDPIGMMEDGNGKIHHVAKVVPVIIDLHHHQCYSVLHLMRG